MNKNLQAFLIFILISLVGVGVVRYNPPKEEIKKEVKHKTKHKPYKAHKPNKVAKKASFNMDKSFFIQELEQNKNLKEKINNCIDGRNGYLVLGFITNVMDLTKLSDNKNKSMSFKKSVYFDYDGDGLKERTAWIDDFMAFLAIDKNNDGKIIGSDELVNFNTLRKLDDNNDGKIDNQDFAYNTLKVWRDANWSWALDRANRIDGDTQEYELKTLSESSIQTIHIPKNKMCEKTVFGNIYGKRFIEKIDGKKLQLQEIEFKVDWQDTFSRDLLEFIITDTIRYPNSKSYGKLREFRNFSNKNVAFLEQMRIMHGDDGSDFDRYDDFAKFDEDVEVLITKWAETDDKNKIVQLYSGLPDYYFAKLTQEQIDTKYTKLYTRLKNRLFIEIVLAKALDIEVFSKVLFNQDVLLTENHPNVIISKAIEYYTNESKDEFLETNILYLRNLKDSYDRSDIMQRSYYSKYVDPFRV